MNEMEFHNEEVVVEASNQASQLSKLLNIFQNMKLSNYFDLLSQDVLHHQTYLKLLKSPQSFFMS